jgi:hypothetical protein
MIATMDVDRADVKKYSIFPPNRRRIGRIVQASELVGKPSRMSLSQLAA